MGCLRLVQSSHSRTDVPISQHTQFPLQYAQLLPQQHDLQILIRGLPAYGNHIHEEVDDYHNSILDHARLFLATLMRRSILAGRTDKL
jgi:hypothetical protein